ncbi:MAG: hypothetical protein QF362_02405 [Candidatus Woesearchaeota archaeon]|jgi:hypothetical protein|nr:hypothetical protein [Candidatus Woesearchaeota archaeon]
MAEKKKKISLEEITENLDPDKINERIEMPHAEAHHKYKLDKIKVSDYSGFRDKIIDYVKHHHKETIGGELSEEDAFGKAQQILESELAPQGQRSGGFLRAYDMARKGKLDEIIKTLATSMESEQRANYVNNEFLKIDPQDFNAHVDFVNQYMDKYGSLLPAKFQKKSAEELAKSYQSLIQHHMGIVEGVKERTKKYEPVKKEEKKAA